MPDRRLARLLLPAALLCAGACAPRPSGYRPPVPAGLERIHDGVCESRRDHERGLALIASGDPVMGRNLVAAATDRLLLYAQECSRIESCEPSLLGSACPEPVAANHGAPAVGVVAAGLGIPGPPAAESPFVDEIPELGRTVHLLDGVDLAEIITINGPVKAALYDWLTWNQAVLLEAYENYQFLRRKLAPIYEKAGLPEALLFAVMAKEGGGKVHVYSRAGAAGPLQFMPSTARRYGLGAEDGFDMRLDPEASTKASADYLNDQFSALNRSLETTLAAYNAGETRVRRFHRRLEGADFWDPEMYWSLPRETRDYVPQVLAAAWIFLHPEEYGVEFPVLETSTTKIVLREAMSLDEMSICLGTRRNRNGWYRAIRNLNPRHRPHKTIPAGTEVELPSVLVPLYADHCIGEAALARVARDLHHASRHDSEVSRP